MQKSCEDRKPLFRSSDYAVTPKIGLMGSVLDLLKNSLKMVDDSGSVLNLLFTPKLITRTRSDL